MTDDKLLAVYSGIPVDRRWFERQVVRSGETKMAFVQLKVREKILQKHPEVIDVLFKLVEEAKAKPSVHNGDVYSFHKLAFKWMLFCSKILLLGVECAPFEHIHSGYPGMGNSHSGNLCGWVSYSALFHLQADCIHICMVRGKWCVVLMRACSF